MLEDISFYGSVSATVQILIMAACGYGLFKSGIIDDHGLEIITRVLINFLLPVFMFHQLTAQFDFREFPGWWMFPLIGIGIILAGLALGRLVLVFAPGIASKREFLSLVVFQNSGYIPLMLVTTLFSGEVAGRLYVYIFLLLIGFNLMMWSLGVWLLSPGQEGAVDIKKLVNPPLAALAVTLAVIALGWHRFVPGVLVNPLELFSRCMLPTAMIVIGGGLARIQLTAVRIAPMACALIVKLVILPLLALGIVWLFKVQSLIGFLLVLETVVPSAVTLSVIAKYYRADEAFVNQGIFYTHIFSLITIPLFLMAYAKLAARF